MEDTIRLLVMLQKVNTKMDQVARDRDSLKLDVQRQQETVSALESRLEGARKGSIDLQRLADSRELKIRSTEEEIKKLQVQLNMIRTQKEFDALREEIRSRNEQISKLEDEELEHLAAIDENNKLVKDLRRQVDEERQRLDKIKGEVDIETARLDSEYAKLEQECKKLRDSIKPEILNQYDRLVAGKRNALVNVRNRICQGCHTMVPLQILNEIMRKDRMVFCHSCGRMLYLDDEYAENSSGK